MAEKNQKLVVAILEFLEESTVDGSVLENDKKRIEAAIQCISEAFGVSPSDEVQRQKLSIKPATLQSLFESYLREKVATPETIGTSSTAVKATIGAPSNSSTPSAADKSQAEQLRMKGNGLMTSKDYAGAITAYTSAIELNPTSALYYSNRAAAHSSRDDHKGAVKDAKTAIELDSNMVHAYHRLGHALYCLGEYQESANIFQQGLDIDPNNANLKSGRDHANARIPSGSTSRPALPTPASGEGGLTELINGLLGGDSRGNSVSGISQMVQGIMQNPEAMTMIQQLLAQNGGLGGLIGNPAINDMMNLGQSGDMTLMGGLMNNPAIMDIVSIFMGGANSARLGGA